jgi:hypothetical protein
MSMPSAARVMSCEGSGGEGVWLRVCVWGGAGATDSTRTHNVLNEANHARSNPIEISRAC